MAGLTVKEKKPYTPRLYEQMQSPGQPYPELRKGRASTSTATENMQSVFYDLHIFYSFAGFGGQLAPHQSRDTPCILFYGPLPNCSLPLSLSKHLTNLQHSEYLLRCSLCVVSLCLHISKIYLAISGAHNRCKPKPGCCGTVIILSEST